jgi:glycosyltransferase involved in cell wall biosynthesis
MSGVRALGPLEPAQVRGWLARASIYVTPARYEPFGLSILEAARAGCALVLGDIRSLREHWNGAALFVPPDNRRALASAIGALIADAELRGRLSRAAASRSHGFTVAAMAGAYLEVYEEAAAGRAARVA